MKKFIPHLFVLFSFFFLGTKQAKASHAAGGEIIYEWVSDSTFRFYFKFYRSCEGINEPPNVTLCVYNDCGYNTTQVVLNKLQTLPDGSPNGSEVSPGCPGYPTQCQGGSLPGYREWWYSNTWTSKGPCNAYHFYIGISARNDAIGNLQNPGNQYLFIDALLNNEHISNFSSPYFTVKPVPYTCNGIPFTYNNGAVDPNNDSLAFDIINPRNGGASCPNPGDNPIAFQAATPAYNTTDNPFPCNNTFVCSPTTGQESFTPAQNGVYVFTTRVRKFRAGELLSQVIRDIQIVIKDCNVPQPVVDVDQASIVGGTYQNNRVEACALGNFNFCFTAKSPDTGAVLVVTDNHATVAPGSNMSYTNMFNDSVRGCFDWTPGIFDTGLKVLTITVKDSTCRPPGIPITQTYVIPLYVYPVTIATGDTTMCLGDSAHLFVQGGSGFTWTVLPGGDAASLTCPTCQDMMVAPTVTTSYEVLSNILPNCRNRDTVVVKVVAPPVFTTVDDVTTCINNSAQLSVGIAPNDSTTYNITWIPTVFLDNPTSFTPVTTPTIDTTYMIIVASNDLGRCRDTTDMHVRVLQAYKIYNHDTAICHGDQVQINATGETDYVYSWQPQANVFTPGILNPYIKPDTTGTYTITAQYPGCRDSSTSITIDVQPIPVVTMGYADTAVCYNARIHLRATVGPDWYQHYIYDWQPASYVDNYTILNPLTQATESRTFVFTASTPAGCKAQDSSRVDVIPVSFIESSPDTTICPRDRAHLSATTSSSVVISSILWTPNLYISDTNTLTIDAWPTTNQQYIVYATDTNGCVDSAITSVFVRSGAVVSLPDSVSIYPGQTYQMEPGGNCTYFAWFPGAGLSSDNISNPMVNPELSTRYHVYASTEYGCKSEDSIDVFVRTDSYINIPNAFSPGSEPNGKLKVLHLGTATLKSFVIYNRWGEKMYESKDINEGWDGTYKGNAQPTGVYVYMVEAVSPTGKKFVKQGNVTLLR